VAVFEISVFDIFSLFDCDALGTSRSIRGKHTSTSFYSMASREHLNIVFDGRMNRMDERKSERMFVCVP
jgi:hypothetical protein